MAAEDVVVSRPLQYLRISASGGTLTPPSGNWTDVPLTSPTATGQTSWQSGRTFTLPRGIYVVSAHIRWPDGSTSTQFTAAFTTSSTTAGATELFGWETTPTTRYTYNKTRYIYVSSSTAYYFTYFSVGATVSSIQNVILDIVRIGDL